MRNSTRSRFASLVIVVGLVGGPLSQCQTLAADGVASPFSQAGWIAPPERISDAEPAPLFRKAFTLDANPKQVTLRILGLGDYDPYFNGQRLASTGINQPWSEYDKTLYYRDYDVTSIAKQGDNCVGVLLTNSFWHNQKPPDSRYFKSGPQRAADEPHLLRAEVIIEHADGTRQTIGTDASWTTHSGPVSFSHIFAGEDYDARLELSGWNGPEFDDSGWEAARVAATPPGKLREQQWPAVEVIEQFKPASILEAGEERWTYAFPQNCSAQLRIKVSGGESGDQITLRCAEHKNEKNRVFGHYVISSKIVTDGEPVTHQWSSFYFGMQFVEVTGAVPAGEPNPDGLPVIESLDLLHVRTALPTTGSFACSSELLNKTHNVIDWAIQSNMSHVLTDCPHREKLGWLEVAYLMAPSIQYRYDSDAWFAKILQDIRDAQQSSGRIQTVAPTYPAGRFPDKFNWTVEWGAAGVLLPWRQYEWTGDRQVLEDNFDMMRQFVDFVGTEAEDGKALGGLGDWYDYGHGQPPGPSRFTPTELTATATWALCAKRVAQAAEVLGRAEQAQHYRELHEKIAADFQKHFRDDATGSLMNWGSPQCANAIALYADVAPEADRGRRVQEIIADLEKRDFQQTPGDVGHVYFIRALAQAGRSDVLHRVYARDGRGSYGGIVNQGLTSMPETWDAVMDGYQSLNHCMLGHVMEWFYGYVAGIRQQPGSAGWTDILIAPNPGPLVSADAEVRVPTGQVASRWTVEDGRFTLEATVPPGVNAVARLPSGAEERLVAGHQTLTEPWNSERTP